MLETELHVNTVIKYKSSNMWRREVTFAGSSVTVSVPDG